MVFGDKGRRNWRFRTLLCCGTNQNDLSLPLPATIREDLLYRSPSPEKRNCRPTPAALRPNHPTAVSPFPGAATGSGGEIRDEGACGTGSKPKAGCIGYTVSNLLIPGCLLSTISALRNVSSPF